MKYIIIFLIFTGLLHSCKNNDQSQIINQNNKNLSANFKESIKRGEEIYSSFCVTCHMPNGKGVPNSFPPLANSDYLKNNRTKSIKAIKYGMSEEIVVNGKTYNMPMAALGLSNDEVSDVMNYITNSWGNENLEAITPQEVSEIKP